jgi:hypothetical protein
MNHRAANNWHGAELVSQLSKVLLNLLEKPQINVKH